VARSLAGTLASTMLRGLRPPYHKADAPGCWISPLDDCWDFTHIEGELEELEALVLAEVRRAAVQAAADQAGVLPDELAPDSKAAAEAVVLTQDEKQEARSRHPWARFLGGGSRFDLSAPDMGPSGPVSSVREYLKPDAKPTGFWLRRLSLALRAEIDVDREDVIGRLRRGEDVSPARQVARWTKIVRYGVRKITAGDDVLWEASSPAETVPAEWLEQIGELEGGAALHLMQLAAAVERYNAPLSVSEGKR